jgi:transcriptional regulator with XRE-family HTH domain
MNIQNLKNKELKNSAVKEEYEQLEAEFALIDTLLTMRKKACLTQDEVAQKMGTQKSNISRLERGSSNPSWKTLQNYANACGFEIAMKVKNMSTRISR